MHLQSTSSGANGNGNGERAANKAAAKAHYKAFNLLVDRQAEMSNFGFRVAMMLLRKSHGIETRRPITRQKLAEGIGIDRCNVGRGLAELIDLKFFAETARDEYRCTIGLCTGATRCVHPCTRAVHLCKKSRAPDAPPVPPLWDWNLS